MDSSLCAEHKAFRQRHRHLRKKRLFEGMLERLLTVQ